MIIQSKLDFGITFHFKPYLSFQIFHDAEYLLVFEDAAPAECPVEVENDGTALETFTFHLPNGSILIALWVQGTAHDASCEVVSDLILPGVRCTRVTGIDVLNGFEQELSVSVEGGNTVLRKLLIKDYPVVLKVAR